MKTPTTALMLAPMLGMLGMLACASDPDGTTTMASSSETGSTGDGDGDGDATGDGDGEPPIPPDECQTDADCVVVNDCCTCGVAPANDVPVCDTPACDQSSCDAQFGNYLPRATCFAGGCKAVPETCDVNQVTCPDPDPGACPAGTFRSTVADCWGPCLPAQLCRELPSLMSCAQVDCGPGYGCADSQVGGSACVYLPPSCGTTPDCACVDYLSCIGCGGACSVSSGAQFLCEDGG